MSLINTKRTIHRLFWAVLWMSPAAGALAQAPGGGGVRGTLYDSARRQAVDRAFVSLLRVDSSAVAATRTGKEGQWMFEGIPAGQYKLLVSGAGLADARAEVTVLAGKVADIGRLLIGPKVDLLRSVVVTPGTTPMRVHGDTLVYNTAAMKLRVNETVEELLGRLRGLQVGADGTITYNGEVIKQLLVDGEDIFAMDPSVVARNFDASRIARVEMLDRKDDQSRFSGIDDGSRTKTLNLVLKESSKQGSFGKVEAGGSPEGYYDGNALLASFRRKEQFTVLGLAANTGVTSIGGGSSGEISLLNGNVDALGASAGKGVPRFEGAAVHYVNAWDGQANHLLGNYQYSDVFTKPVTTTYTVEALPDSLYTQAMQSRSINRQDQQWAYGIYDYVPDSLSTFNFTVHGSWTGAHNMYSDSGWSAWNGALINDSRSSIVDDVTRVNVGTSAGWRRRGRRQPGRILSVVGSWTSIAAATNGYVYSLSRYNKSGGLLVDTVDQRKAISDHTVYLVSTLSYVEPLWRGLDLGLSYWIQDEMDQAVQGTFDKGDGKYDLSVDSLSSSYNTSGLTQQAFVTLQGERSGWKYMIAGGLQVYGFHLHDESGDSGLRVQYINAIPRLQVGYTPGPFSHLDLSFTGSTQMPTSAQLQPVPNNTNPLSLALGNPGLRPSLVENGSLQWKRVKVWLVSVSLAAGWVQGAISTRTTTDSLGRQISQPVNVNGGRTLGWNGSVERPVGGWQLGLHTNLVYGCTLNYVDTALNRTDSYTAGGGLSVKRFVPDAYQLQINTQATYFDTRSSVNAGAPVRYWSQSHRGTLSLLFVRGWEFRTDAVYTWQQGTSGLSGATSVMLWNASVSRTLLEGKLLIRAEVKNVLNQNAGISRTNNANVNTESSTNILGRYWMLGAVWRFEKHSKH